MEQHAIPQQISNYEFKLIGEMTLKQFGKAAGGIIIALIINATQMVFFVKWPLALLFGAGGLLLAFVPYEDRPLETWLISFIKSIYSPTIYLYKKRASKNWLEVDWSKKLDEDEKEEEDEIRAIKDKSRVNEFIESLPSVNREEEIKEQVVDKPMPTKAVVIDKQIDNSTQTVDEQTKIEEGWRDKKADLNLKSEKLEATGKVNFGAIPMPGVPEIPNLIVGMATDNAGRIVEGAIVEIQDINGNPNRVLKTNSLGQFRISTPITNGRYLIITEKDGYNFDRVNIEMTGQIVQPVRIIAK